MLTEPRSWALISIACRVLELLLANASTNEKLDHCYWRTSFGVQLPKDIPRPQRLKVIKILLLLCLGYVGERKNYLITIFIAISFMVVTTP